MVAYTQAEMRADRRRAWHRIRRRESAAAHALGYVRLRGGEKDLAAQRSAIRAWALEHCVTLATVVHDQGRGQPSLAWALAQVADGSAQALVVPRLRDLAGELPELAPLLRWFLAQERRLVALDVAVDTATEAGRLAISAVAGVVAANGAAGDAERDAARRHGRPAVADTPALELRIQRMREDGMTLQAIADVLNAEGVPTVRGGRLWRPSSVQRATGYRRPSSSARGIELPDRPG
jgi:DNA invertase Pin-like site-specific DNA recombinase